jgi:hypothetical protein
MRTAANLRNLIDAQIQLRRFDPDAPVVVVVGDKMHYLELAHAVIDTESGRSHIVLTAGPEVTP